MYVQEQVLNGIHDNGICWKTNLQVYDPGSLVRLHAPWGSAMLMTTVWWAIPWDLIYARYSQPEVRLRRVLPCFAMQDSSLPNRQSCCFLTWSLNHTPGSNSWPEQLPFLQMNNKPELCAKPVLCTNAASNWQIRLLQENPLGAEGWRAS